MTRRGTIEHTIVSVIDGMARILSHVFTYKLIKYIRLLVNRVQWYAYRRRFGAVGNNSYIEFPSLITNPQNIYLGNNFSALSRFRIETFSEYRGETFSPRIVIGDNVAFNNDCHLGCIDRIEIGNNVLGASRIYISDHYHGSITAEGITKVPVERPLYSKGPVVIKDNVWLGEGVAIMPGVTIGCNSIIGANSVVTCDIPDNAVAAGVPAKVLKKLA